MAMLINTVSQNLIHIFKPHSNLLFQSCLYSLNPCREEFLLDMIKDVMSRGKYVMN